MKEFNILIFTFLIFSCSEQIHDDLDYDNTQLITIESIDDSLHKKIVVSDIYQKEVFDSVEFIGFVSAPPQSTHFLYSLINGFVKNVYVFPGSHIKRGDVLCVLTHPDILSLQQEYLGISIQYITDSLEYFRQLNLFSDSATSPRNLEQSKSVFYKTKFRLLSLEKFLIDLNLNPEKIRNGYISPEISIKSPVTGFIKQVYINSGYLAQPNTLLFEILDINNLYIEIPVSVDFANKINRSDTILIRSFPDNSSDFAKVISINPLLDDQTKLVNIYCKPISNNSSYILGQQVYGTVVRSRNKAFFLPVKSLVVLNNKNYIFVKNSKKTFGLKEINLFKRTDSDIFFTIDDNDKQIKNVVTEGFEILKGIFFSED